jgi:molecular chaperone DnaK (HSP70)
MHLLLIHRKKEIYINRNGEGSYKTPTSILTGPKDEFIAFGYDAESEYSNKLKDGRIGYHLFKNFKMMVHMNTNLSKTTEVKSITGKSMPAFDVFVYIFISLKKNCLDSLMKSALAKPADDTIRWVLTVPATCSDTAKDFMRQVALKAGLIKAKESDQLILASEPEAAALYCKETPIQGFGLGAPESPMSLAKDDKYIVIIAGSETVDIAGYQVLESGKTKELIVANGGPWGGVQVDKNFKELLFE